MSMSVGVAVWVCPELQEMSLLSVACRLLQIGGKCLARESEDQLWYSAIIR